MSAARKTLPRISVAVSTYRRPDRIMRLLQALAKQTLPPGDFEVVVYDDASGDDTVEQVRRAAAALPYSLRLVEGEENRGPASGRNVAWRAGLAPLVAFIDDDCVPDPGWLAAGLAAFDANPVGAVVGHVEPAPDQLNLQGPFSRTLRVTDARFFATANCFYRREALEAADGFDERFRRAAGEDTDLGLRVMAAGWTTSYSADALVHHDVRPSSFRASAREAWSKWVDLALVVRKHPQVRRTLMYRRVFWKKPHALLLLALAGAIAAAFLPWLALLALPYVYHRLRSAPLAGGTRRITTFPGALALDLLELGAMVRSTARYRTLVI
jgi:GT2 family glycosyltransferase